MSIWENKKIDGTWTISVITIIIVILTIEGILLFVIHSLAYEYMKRDYWLILLACFVGGIMILWNSIDDEDEDEKSDHRSSSDSVPPFIPTHEWQEVKEGQSIPPVF